MREEALVWLRLDSFLAAQESATDLVSSADRCRSLREGTSYSTDARGAQAPARRIDSRQAHDETESLAGRRRDDRDVRASRPIDPASSVRGRQGPARRGGKY